MDQARQVQYEMFCGLDLTKHLPSLSLTNIECVSRHPAAVLKPISSVVSNLVHQPELLLQDSGNFCWICSADLDIVELYIYLPQPR